MDRWVGSGVGAGDRVERERRRGGTVNVSGRPGRVLEREGQTDSGGCVWRVCGGCCYRGGAVFPFFLLKAGFRLHRQFSVGSHALSPHQRWQTTIELNVGTPLYLSQLSLNSMPWI